MQQDTAGAKTEQKPGEKAFALALFLVGAGALWQSLLLWQAASPPRLASAAALPLVASLAWTALSLAGMLRRSGRRGNRGGKSALAYALPRPLPLIFAAIAAYCLALFLQVSFFIATPLFLWGSMCYLTRRDFLKNILWTALCMVFIVLIFKALFQVILP